MEATILRIAKWEETFVKSEGKRSSTLHWVSLPVAFFSSGYQALLDDHQDDPRDAPALYGAWCAIVAYAATCPLPGILANSKGAPVSISQISRITGFHATIIEGLLNWASSPQVGWLEVVTPEEFQELVETSGTRKPRKSKELRPPNNRPTTAQQLPNNCPAEVLGYSTLQDRTEQDSSYRCNSTPDAPERRGRSIEAAAAEDGLNLVEIREAAKRLEKTCPQIATDRIWRYAWLSEALSPGFLANVCTDVKTGLIRKPQNYIEKALKAEAEQQGKNYHQLAASVPEWKKPPLPQEPAK